MKNRTRLFLGVSVIVFLFVWAPTVILGAGDAKQSNAAVEVSAAEEGTEAEQTAPADPKKIKPVRGVAGGVAHVGEGAKEMVEQTVEETKEGKPIQGLGAGSKAMVDSTVKGAYKVATLGYDELEDDRLGQEAPRPKQSMGRPGADDEGRPGTFKIKF